MSVHYCTNLNKLQVAQNTLARVMCEAPRSVSATELHRQLHWSSIHQRITYEIYSRPYIWDENHQHRCLLLSSDSALRTRTDVINCQVSNLSCRSLRSSGHGDLCVLQANTFIGQRSFTVVTPVVWTLFHLNSAHRTTVADSSDLSWKLKSFLTSL